MADRKAWSIALFNIHLGDGGTRGIAVSGRDRWALEALIAAGERGCTPLDTPGPRWSGYVFNLRQLGVLIETLTEPHDGPFAGTHARYVLEASVTRSGGGWGMTGKQTKAPTPRDLFERKIHHQFGLSGAVLRALGELHYQGKP